MTIKSPFDLLRLLDLTSSHMTDFLQKPHASFIELGVTKCTSKKCFEKDAMLHRFIPHCRQRKKWKSEDFTDFFTCALFSLVE